MDNEIALGMIETKGLIGLIEASDAAVKTAKVIAVDYEKTGSGLCIIKLRGTVGAVKAAVEAGARAAQKIGQLVAAHVIPNPDQGIEPMITPAEHPGTRQPAREFHKWGKVKKEPQKNVPQKRPTASPAMDSRVAGIMETIKRGGADTLSYNDLRYIARRSKNFPIPKAEIRKASKAELLKAVTDTFEKE